MNTRALTDQEIYQEAEFYDMEFQNRAQEIPFFLKWSRHAQGPILEAACGTGRITIPIAQAGLDITGSDLSPAMLHRARQKSAQIGLHIDWQEQDCRRLSAHRPYHLIFSATNAMQHLLDRESILSFLRSARQALHPQGRLILDVFNPHPEKLIRTPDTRYHHKRIPQPHGPDIQVEAASEYHRAEQILEFQLFYTKEQIEICRKRVRMRCFFPEELLLYCHVAGLNITHRFGNYDESPFQNDSPKQILICQPAQH